MTETLLEKALKRAVARERILEWAEAAGCSDSSALDDLVHDVMSSKASDINNHGVPGQVKFLLAEGVSEAEIQETLGGD